MDIDLLSKMVKEMILDRDRVVLPGLGSFVAEMVPATFSDKGYTINPPYRRLFFRQKPDEGGDLVTIYAESNKIDPQMAEKILRNFLSELKAVLHEKKTVVFPGLGRLRATKENHLFFVADENLDIYPEGFGLEPISLKTHQETSEEVTAAVEGLKSLVTEVVAEPVAEPEVVVETEPVVEAESVVEPEPSVEPVIVPEAVHPVEAEPESFVEIVTAPAEEPVIGPELVIEADSTVEQEVETAPVASPKKSPWKTVMKVFLWLIAVAVILLAAFVIVGHLYPEWIDQFLYTPEELEILNNY